MQEQLTLDRVPLQTTFGRRPVLIISTLICLVSNIWRAVAKDYNSFMGACILNGIGAGPAEVGPRCQRHSVQQLTKPIADCSADHHRRHHVPARERCLQYAIFYGLLWLAYGWTYKYVHHHLLSELYISKRPSCVALDIASALPDLHFSNSRS